MKQIKQQNAGILEKPRLKNLSIEITRRCNMACGHCMRGNAQDLDISHKDIRHVLKNVQYIGHFNITGGEPSLNTGAIKYILKQVKRFGVEVYEFYIVTNGSESSISGEFIDLCSGLYQYQQKKGMQGSLHMLEMSDDRFHDNKLHQEVVRKLKKYPFFCLRGQSDYIFLYKEGRSQNGNANPIRELYVDDENFVKGCVYLNAEGVILSNGDLSYQRQRENKLCHSGSFLSYVKYHVEKY